MNTQTQHPLAHCRLILASQSPRRRELLQTLGVPFSVSPPFEADERLPEYASGVSAPAILAQRKAHACPCVPEADQIIVAADTLVYCRERLLGKPHNAAQAQAMLERLSGSMHEVLTGVCLRFANAPMDVFCERTAVYFAPMTAQEINYYISRFEPYDKAGAYGIQEWLGYACIERIEGSYSNVMGLPVQRLYDALKQLRIKREQKASVASF